MEREPVFRMNCAFCELPQIKARTILENDLAWVFPSFYPIVPVHLLVCPKRCVAGYEDLTPQEREAMFALMAQLKPALAHVYQADGYNYAWNEGVSAGQTVPHIHIHFVPRRAHDKKELGFDPKDHFYTADMQNLLPEEALLEIKKTIQTSLVSLRS